MRTAASLVGVVACTTAVATEKWIPRPALGTEWIGLEKHTPATDQVQRLCDKYPAFHTCAKITAAVDAHIVHLLAQPDVDFAIVNLTIPAPGATFDFDFEFDGERHRVALRPAQDPSLAIALFCRAHPHIGMHQCDALRQHAFRAAVFTFDESSTPHYFRSMRPSQLVPISQRAYFEIDRPLDDARFYFNMDTTPSFAGALDADEPVYVKAYVAPAAGPSMVVLANASTPLHAVFFTLVDPSISLEIVQGDRLRLHLHGIDPHDTRQRICLYDNSATSFNCLAKAALIQAITTNSLNVTVDLPLLVTGRVAGLVVNEYNKVVCISSTLSIPHPTATTTTTDTSLLFMPPRRDPNRLAHNMPSLDIFFDHEWGLFSQNGEDGILQHLFHRVVPPSTMYYVEFGAEDGHECNTRFLRQVDGWTGLLLDGSHANASINLHQAWISPNNIVSLLDTHAVPHDLDLLSVDIDFNDYYVLEAILRADYTPRVVVVEVNSHFDDARVVTYDAHGWDGVSNYFGATPKAFCHLLAPAYTLVYCESHGVNCFFVRADLWPSTADCHDVANAVHRWPNFFGKGWAYPDPATTAWRILT
ncbi:Aste57867_11818 [Aphanomyces stellatus]|uniref:Aste57867_11818 protein n=1 Tax=Aphanomyces stellatus TaxID=120398 RepID=A0A485KU09_9STRA|nr:hypothetical protein As57867_011773 [Aphanomyces stellatus]VFT88673.1 Aste57867_11818 [Aphanomyces stellatus]